MIIEGVITYYLKIARNNDTHKPINILTGFENFEVLCMCINYVFVPSEYHHDTSYDADNLHFQVSIMTNTLYCRYMRCQYRCFFDIVKTLRTSYVIDGVMSIIKLKAA